MLILFSFLISSIFCSSLPNVSAEGEDDDEWDLAKDVEFADMSAPEINESVNSTRAMKSMRARGHTRLLKFQALNYKFIFEVEDNRYLIKQANVRPLICQKMTAIQKDGTEETINRPLARFLIGSDGASIKGGFSYNNYFYRLQGPDHPLLSETVRKQAMMRNGPSKKDGLVVTRRSLTKKHLHKGKPQKCGTDDLYYNRKKAKSIQKLKALRPSKKPGKVGAQALGSAYPGCPKNPQQISVGIVGDCNYVKIFGGEDKARDEVLTEMNLASGIFLATYNIDIAVSSLDMHKKCDNVDSEDPLAWNVPCKNYPGLDVALNRFSTWRDNHDTSASIVHLVMSSCRFDRLGDFVQLQRDSGPCLAQSGLPPKVLYRQHRRPNLGHFNDGLGAKPLFSHGP